MSSPKPAVALFSAAASSQPVTAVPAIAPSAEAETYRVLRQAMWVPCETKEDLARWCRVYLGVHFPDGHVDPVSNSSPMELLWEVYSKARENNDPNFNRVMAYASRISFKTLAAAVLEVLCLVHLDRDVVHLAAIKEQSQKAQEYVKTFFGRPFLRDFLMGDASTYTEIYHYVQRNTGEILSPKEWKGLPDPLKLQYEEKRGYIDITSCTMAGTNSKHAAFMVVDEVDVIEGEKVRAYEQAKLIPDDQRGKMNMTLLISTRKTLSGKVQAEIQNAPQTGLILRHWNVIDVTEPCPTDRHRPDKPKVTLYRNPKNIRVITEEEFKLLDENQQVGYEPHEAFWGCQHQCKLFGPCRGGLASKASFERTGAMKRLTEVTNQFSRVSPEMAVAELLCYKPGTEGLIYPSMDESIHLLTAAQIASLITGERVSEPFGKEQLVSLMLSRDFRPVAGIDFGFSHNFSLAMGFTDGYRVYITSAASQAELMPDKQLSLSQKHCKPLRNPDEENEDYLYSARIFADPENPQMCKVLKNGGLNIVKWKKGAGSLLAGIEAVRVALGSAIGASPRLIFLRGDPYTEFFFQRMAAWAWTTGADGKPSDIPSDTDDDEADSVRYLVMNVLGKYSGLVVAPDQVTDAQGVASVGPHAQLLGMPGQPTPKASKAAVLSPEATRQLHWNQIAGMVGMATIEPGETQAAVRGSLNGDMGKGRKGSFSWDI